MDAIINDKRLLKIYYHLEKLLENNDTNNLSLLLEMLHPADIAEMLSALDESMANILFETMKTETLAIILPELDDLTYHKVLNKLSIGNLSNDKIAEIIKLMPSDEAADILVEIDDKDKIAEIL